jgi:hypothetical protein
VIYFISCFGTAFIFEICFYIASNISIISYINLCYSFEILKLILKFVSIIIIMATAIIVVKKRCNKTLREHDDGRAARGAAVDKYDKNAYSTCWVFLKLLECLD